MSGPFTSLAFRVFVTCFLSVVAFVSANSQSPVDPPTPKTAPRTTSKPPDQLKATEDGKVRLPNFESDDVTPPTVSEEDIARWIDSLSSKQFAVREDAATRLVASGNRVLSRLREVAASHTDPEVRLRAGKIVNRLTQGDLKAKIDDFLAGKEVQFEGWDYTESFLGDSTSVRELFVEVLKSHPQLTASLSGPPRDRAIALEKTVAAVEDKMYRQRQYPNAADAVALLLPAADENVPLKGGYEDILMSVLQKPAVSNLHRDDRLTGPFNVLLGRWLVRSSMKNREEVLFYGLSWDVTETHQLAIQTLTEAQQTETLVLAFQAIARFGNKADTPAVAKFLDDERPAAERGFADGRRVRTELRDVAMATIARLHKVPLKDVGFARDSMNERFGFLLDDLGFQVGEQDARAATRSEIDKLIEPAAEEGS